MNILLQSIQSADLSIYHFLNGFAGNWFLDRLGSIIESTNLLNGGFVLAIYWYLWFRSGPDREKRREAIIVILLGVMLSLVVARTIAFAAPFRLRPVYDPAVQHQPYAWPASASLENWSAFPSDTATFFFGLACGIACLSRRLAIPVTLYTAVWISLPRMYFGIHYASDMVMGAAIGIAVVWFALRTGWLRSRLASRALAAAHATPSVFYAAAFLVSYEMATMFGDIRDVVRGLLHLARVGPHQETVRSALIAVAILGLAAGGACWASQYHPSRGAREPRAVPQ